MNIEPEKMDVISKGAFAPIYPLIASQIVERSSVKKGICVDVGTGPAALSIALARITDLEIYAMDISKDMCRKAQENVYKAGLYGRIVPVRGDVAKMPFPDNFANLVVSRGSIPFWKDLTGAFKEIKRVLKPDGFGYVGGGFGSSKMKAKIKRDRERKLKSGKYKKTEIYQNPKKINVHEVENATKNAGITRYSIINDDSGMWFLIRK
jgi:ubiquinone/menaquinone biosynthesis C-methylase UbiE